MNSLITHFNNLFFPLFPETRCFGLKRAMWRLAGAKVGMGVRISSSVKIVCSGQLEIGEGTWLGSQVLLAPASKIVIGKKCDIAPRVYIGNGTHEISPYADRIAGKDVALDVSIGDGCWLCANSSILPGVTMGNKCVVAAGAVVTKSFKEDKVLIAGVPAEIKKKL